MTFVSVPSLIIVCLNHDASVLAPYIKVPFRGKVYKLRLRGIVYGGGYHFTSRVIDVDGTIWFHDGQVTKSTCRRDGSLNRLTRYENLRFCGREPYRKKAMQLIYARD